MLTKSLEDFRHEHYMEVTEFTEFLEISPKTYYRILKRDVDVRPRTMRKVASRLNVAPPDIAEFFPPPSSSLLAQLTERVDHAEMQGAIIFDIERGEPTQERVAVPADALATSQ